jgi:hypothetical protein
MAVLVKEKKDFNDSKEFADQGSPSLDKISLEFRKEFAEIQSSSIAAYRSLTSFRQLRSHLRNGLGTVFNSTQQKQLFEAKIKLNVEANRLVIPLHYLAPPPMLESYILSPTSDHQLVSGWREPFTKIVLEAIFKSSSILD